MNIPNIIENETKYINSLEITEQQKCKLLLSLYRMFTLDSQLYSVLHGSTAITENNNAVLFGDGLECLGKTTASLLVASKTKKYVIDETTLYNQATGSVYGNQYRQIHIRKDLIPLFNKLFNTKIKPKTDDVDHTTTQELGLEVIPYAKLKAIVCPHYDKNPRIIEETDPFIKRRKVSIAVNAHHLKLAQSELDRVNKPLGEQSVVVDIIDYTAGLSIPDGILNIPYYDCYYETADQLNNLLKGVDL